MYYDLPDYGFNNAPFQTIDRDGLSQWQTWRQLANQACEAFLGYVQTSSENRTWSHHFDTGIFTQINTRMGVGFGLAMSDSMVPSPYFFLTGYLSDKEIDYTNPPHLDRGNWKTEDWKGAVFPLSDVSALKREDGVRALKAFMVETTLWYLSQ